MTIVPPCKECPKKGCGSFHDICEEYIKYKTEVERLKKERYDQGRTEFELDAIKFRNLERRKKLRTRLKQR